MSKIRVYRHWVIKVHINYWGFIVWDDNPELLVPGVLILCSLSVSGWDRKSRGCLISEVHPSIKINEVPVHASDLTGLAMFRLGWPQDELGVLLAVHTRGMFLCGLCGGWTCEHITKGQCLFNRLWLLFLGASQRWFVRKAAWKRWFSFYVVLARH